MSVKAVWVDYWDKEMSHRPYRGVLHDPETDNSVSQVLALQTAAMGAGIQDGDEIEITIRRTGRRPFGDRRVVWTAPHTYTRQDK